MPEQCEANQPLAAYGLYSRTLWTWSLMDGPIESGITSVRL